MADDLFGGPEAETTPVDISDLVTVNPLPANPLPIPATRNAAVQTALVADPGNGQEHYNNMMDEASRGDTTTMSTLKQQSLDQQKAQDFQSTANIMADPKVSNEQKLAIVQGFNKSRFLQDTGVTLNTNLLQKGANNETPDTEKARISTADALNEMADSRQKIQGIVNGFKDKADADSPASKFFNDAAGLIPFHNSVITAKTLEGLSNETGIPYHWWDVFRTYAGGSGNNIIKLQQMVKDLPPDQQLGFAKSLAKSVQNNTGFLYGNDNHKEAYEFMNKVFNTESYGGGSQFLDNTFGLMDFAFAGSNARDLGQMAKNVKQIVTGKSAIPSFEESQYLAKANANTPANYRQEPTGGASGVVNDVPEPSLNTAAPTERAFNPNASPKQAAQDVNFTESTNGNFHTEGVGPANQLPNPVPKLTAPVVREGEATPVLKQIGETKPQTVARIAVQTATHDINPASPIEIAHNSNPDVARAMHEAIVKGDDEVANAFAGTNRTAAIINDTIPQVSETGTVFSRVADIDKNIRVQDTDPKLVDLVNQTSVNAFTPEEASALRGNIRNDFGNSTGLTPNDAMTSFTENGGRMGVNAVYELPAGSWSDAEAAIEQAKLALRHYGISDDDITLLRKDGINHSPVSIEDARGVEGDYKIQIKSDIALDPSNLSSRGTLDVKRNWFDRFAGTNFGQRSSVNRYIFDAASTLHKVITGSAAIAKDYGAKFEKYMLGKAAEYSDSYSKLSKGAQAKIDDYVREANFKGIAFDKAHLAATGFSPDEVNVISKWRAFWDDHFHLENLDIVRTLRAKGYEYFKNNNAELYARPLGKTPSITRFYDPVADVVRGFNAGELDDLYNKGGHLSALRRPTKFGNDTVEHMIVPNTTSAYSRALRDSDRVLNYKQGYYSITYKAAHFIDEVDATGAKVRTLAVAGDTKEAEAFAKQHMANNPGVLTKVRADRSSFARNSDEAWDINSAGGRLSQRHRGKLLEDASAPNHLGDMKYVANPVESAVRAAKSISGRTVMRPMLENAADRALKQYADVFPKNAYGETRWPTHASEIKAGDYPNTKMEADARTTWEYLNYLRNGYINSIDDGWKAVWNTVANGVGKTAAPAAVERGLRAVGEVGPNGFSRKVVNNLLIATSPLRQLVVQAAAGYRAITYNPIDYANGKIGKDLFHFLDTKYFKGKGNDFTKFLDDTGLVAAVEHHNLTSATLTNLADSANPLTRGARYAVNKLRTIGFDAGENMNIVNHAAAVFRRYERLGKDITNRDVREQMMGEIRALTYNMNAAGDMPYNQGTASALFQFMQMPHKALLFYTNRQIDTATKVRMGIGDLLLWGTSVDALSNALNFDFLPRDDTAGNKVMHDGIIATGYNGLLRGLFGKDTHEADFSSLSPYNLDGWQKLFFETTGGKGAFGFLGTVIANSPAGSLGGKFGQVYKDMSRIWSPMPYDDGNVYEKFQSIVSDVARMSSGWNNLAKATLMVEAGKRRDQYNNIVTDDTTTGDVIAQMFGFTDRQQAENFKLGKKLSGDIESNKQDVQQVYTDIKKYYASKYAQDNVPDFQYFTAVAGAAMQVYADDPKAMEIIQKQIHADITGPDQDLMYKMFQSMEIKGSNDFETEVANGPWDEATKSKMREAYQFSQNAQKDLTELTKGKK